MKFIKMKRVVAATVLFSIVGTGIIGKEAPLLRANEEIKEYVITVDNDAVLKKIKENYAENIVEDYNSYHINDKESLYAGLTKSEKKKVENMEGVLDVEDNITFKASLNNYKPNVKRKKAKKSNALDWNMRMIGATSYDCTKLKKFDTIKIAVMDSGVDVSEDVNVVQRVNLVDEEKNIAPYYEDITSHGTSIAGIISDINPKAELYSVRVLDANNTAKLDRIVEGIYWCIEHDMDIINMSFGTKYNSIALQKAVKAAEKEGILMVSAAGNGGNEASVEYPAAYEAVIAVGSVDKKATLTGESATGEQIELVAPGSEVITDGAYGGSLVAGGTSISVAHITGAASVIWQKDSSKPKDFVRQILCQSAKKLGDNKKFGNGLIDIKFAMNNYDKFEKNYQLAICESQEIEDSIDNDEVVKTFDDVQLVEGRWGPGAHLTIIDDAVGFGGFGEGFSKEELDIIRDACAKVDGIGDGQTSKSKRLFKTDTKLVLHGRYNYVATIRYLYRVSRSMYLSNASTSIDSICREFFYKPDIEPTVIDASDNGVRNAIVEAIEYMTDANTPILNSNRVSWRKQQGLRVFGMMMHVLGDTYAHDSRVPSEAVHYNSNVEPVPSSFIIASQLKTGKSWNSFVNEVNRGIMFKRVREYVVRNYEDDTSVYPDRFIAAKTASNSMIKCFLGGAVDADVDVILKAARRYDKNQVLCEETTLGYFSKHVKSEYASQERAVIAGTVSFNPYIGEYTSYK